MIIAVLFVAADHYNVTFVLADFFRVFVADNWRVVCCS
jgi:hypothetical protein